MQLTTQPYYSSKLYCEAVAANAANTLYQGKLVCIEQRENGRSKILWKKRTGQKMARLTKEDALKDAIIKAQEILEQSKGVLCEIAVLGTIHPKN